MRATHYCLTVVFVLMSFGAASAEVVDKSPAGFTIKTVVQTSASPEVAYASLVGHLAEWWDKTHTYSGDARNLSIRAEPGGCLCEKLPGGGGIQHGTVVYVAPGKLLRISAALGPLQVSGVTGNLTFQFDKAASGTGTTITMIYGVGGYFAGGLDKLAPVVDMVVTQQVERLKAYADKAAR